MNCLWLVSLWLMTILSVTSSQDTDKRAPRPNAFTAMRGKKDVGYDMGYYFDKRVPMGFAGVRGKKLTDDFSSFYESKRAPSRSFFAVKGKRELLTPDLSSLLDDGQVSEMDKRAPSRFFGMRGKKGPSSQSFFGMRGKKDFADLLEGKEFWDSRARYSDDLNQLLEALNAADRAKQDLSGIRSDSSLDSLSSQHRADY